jgi:hypothetical protein
MTSWTEEHHGWTHTVSWFERVDGFDGDLVAQRVKADDTLGRTTGDVDGDGDVDAADLVALLAAWGPCPPPCGADLNDDGTVDVADLLMLLASWN